MARILIIDDEAYIREVLAGRAQQLDHETATAARLKEGLAMLEADAYDLVFLDVQLPDGNGLKALPSILQCPSAPEVIIITGEGSAEGAEMAIKSGAWDYIQKPFNKEEIILQIKRSVDYHTALQKRPAPVMLDTQGIVGESAPMKSCLQQVAQCAAGDANVLLWGETGTGKELFAKAIHSNSHRSERNFVIVDCAAMPEALTESVLFGHVKGAFTGADRSAEGLVKKADGGTLFLDEVGELPLSIQKAFLRVLQERRFRPVGSTVEVQSRFRLVAATNRDLERMVDEGRFRPDLLHRLRTFAIQLPPLRERKEDILHIARHFVDVLCAKHGQQPKALLPEFVDSLKAYDWPGNVRELINALEKAILAEPAIPLLYPISLPVHIRVHATHQTFPQKTEPPATTGDHVDKEIIDLAAMPDPLPDLKTFRDTLMSRIETAYLQHLLRMTGWDLDHAARISGLSKNRLYVLISKHSLRSA